MVDPLDPRNDARPNPINTDPRLVDPTGMPPQPTRGGSSYLLAAVLLVAVLLIGYFFYKGDGGTDTSAPPPAATQSEPATPAPASPPANQ
ncbi:hypothetical protein AAIB41_09165 [Brucella sp. BE17]|uniref:hypothetical protein n=1 Tax=Brucella sp. BE17 TaxID=3142977 RepID=UPI0031BB1845